MRKICEYFAVQPLSSDSGPSYNIAPAQDIIIIKNCGVRRLVRCRWGFMPSWAKNLTGGYMNARAETVTEKQSFRSALRRQRCLVIADGFYEWKKEKKRRVPFYIRLKSGEPLGFAGLYTPWTSPEGQRICTCTILTTESNEIISTIHDRMPVIVPRDKEDTWLSNESVDAEILRSVLRPFPSEELALFRVADRVNSTAHDSSENIQPVPN